MRVEGVFEGVWWVAILVAFNMQFRMVTPARLSIFSVHNRHIVSYWMSSANIAEKHTKIPPRA